MKRLIVIALLGAFGLSEAMATATKEKSITVCQSYIAQATAFKKTMGDDEVSQETFKFYKEKMLVHCGRIVAKTKFEKKSFSEMMMKNDKTTAPACRMAIDIAAKYSENTEQSTIIVAAYRENIADKCGSLVAGHVSSYCLFGDDK